MRKAAILRQKNSFGRRCLAILPMHYPKPLLTAANILGVELWGPPGPPRGPAGARIQTYVCSLARNALAFLAGGHADVVDGVLFPHTCDAIQGLASLAPDFGGWEKASFRYYPPRGEQRASAMRMARAELSALAEQLGAFSEHAVTDDGLRAAMMLHAEIDALRGQLLSQRRSLSLSDATLYALLRRGEYLWPEEYLVELKQISQKLEPSVNTTSVPLMVTGYVPEPIELLETLDNAGAFIAADDYAAVGRRIPRRYPDASEDPMGALAQLMLGMPPCPTRETDLNRRLRYLTTLAKQGNVRGLIIHTIKACEPELFDVPAIRTAFARESIPTLWLESDLESELSHQSVTRIEAFVEMLSETGGR